MSQIHWKFPWFLFLKRVVVRKNSVVKIQNVVGNQKSQPVKLNPASAIQKNNKNKKLNVRRVLLSWKISKNRRIYKHNKKLFVRNYFSKRSTLKVHFVVSKVKVYLVKFFLLNILEATGFLDLDKPQHHYFIKHI